MKKLPPFPIGVGTPPLPVSDPRATSPRVDRSRHSPSDPERAHRPRISSQGISAAHHGHHAPKPQSRINAPQGAKPRTTHTRTRPTHRKPHTSRNIKPQAQAHTNATPRAHTTSAQAPQEAHKNALHSLSASPPTYSHHIGA